MKRLVAASVIIGTIAVTTHAQPANVIIRGRVSALDTGEALTHARVVIYDDAKPLPAIFTDSEGRFASQPLAAARRYRLSATKPGYASTSVAPLDLASVDGVDVRMPRSAAISGRVLDRFGEPAAGVRMSLLVPPAPDRTRPGTLLKIAITDDLGEYRFGGLADGTYFVSATTLGLDARTDTYFPGAPAISDAQAITVHPGDEKTEIDFAGVATQANEFTIGSQIVLQPNTVVVNGRTTTPTPVPGTGIIRGRVTRVDGLPIAYATVTTMAPRTLLGRTTIAPFSAQADEDGQYELSGLPAGRYRVNAAKLGYTSSAYGQRLDDERSTLDREAGAAIDLAEGQTKTRVDITLPRYSAVTGRILDDYGDPVESVAVYVSQIKFDAGRRRLVGVTGVAGRMTDDRGQYRIYGLQPGQYIVSASPGQVMPGQPPSDLSGYAPTYFPSTTNVGEAERVSVPRSQDVTGLDFVLVPTPTATISGRRLGSDGQPIGGSLMLMQSARSGAIITPAAGARLDDDGRFEFPNVPPGDYVIQADRGRFQADAEGDFASQFVTVDGNDVTDVVLQVPPGSTISGRVVFDGDGAPPAIGALTIRPERADLDRTPNPGSIARAGVRQDLTFSMTGIRGPRRLAVERPPAGWGLKAVIAGGVDVTDVSLAFGPPDQSLSDVQVVMTNRLTELTVTATDSQGKAVNDYTLLMFPSDRERWYPGSRYFRRVRPEPGGYFSVRGLPPGDYFAAAVTGASVLKEGGDAWQDPDFLESIALQSARATLTEGQRLSVSARVITP